MAWRIQRFLSCFAALTWTASAQAPNETYVLEMEAKRLSATGIANPFAVDQVKIQKGRFTGSLYVSGRLWNDGQSPLYNVRLDAIITLEGDKKVKLAIDTREISGGSYQFVNVGLPDWVLMDEIRSIKFAAISFDTPAQIEAAKRKQALAEARARKLLEAKRQQANEQRKKEAAARESERIADEIRRNGRAAEELQQIKTGCAAVKLLYGRKPITEIPLDQLELIAGCKQLGLWNQ